MTFEQMGSVVEGKAFGWDDEITAEGGNRTYRILEEGDYAFIIKDVERSMYEPASPDSKIPACPKAIIHMLVLPGKPDATEPVEVSTNLFLHSSQEWKLATFFLAIGVKKKHEPLRMRWDLKGMEGWCHMAPREYNGKKYNNVQYFIEPEKAPARNPHIDAPQPVKSAGFTPGAF